MSAQKTVNLAILIPSNGDWRQEFGISLMHMTVALLTIPLPAPYVLGQVVPIVKTSSLLPRSRQEAFSDAIEQGCTHAICLDADQTFPATIVHDLLKHGKDFVAANVAVKCYPSLPTARNVGDGNFGTAVSSADWKKGLEKVWRIGIAVALIDLAAVKATPKPWFEVRWNEQTGQCVGEDWFFCQKLQEQGVDLYIDHDLSRQVGHMGSFSYQHSHVLDEIQKAA